MKTMQWGGVKILVLVGCATLYSINIAQAQTSGYRLKTADSLFIGKRFVQSFELYESILKKGEYTPAMLLKMAFIQEGLNHTGQAMYYLNLYYLASRDKEALDKMEELATKFNLAGYKTSDGDRFLSFYHDYHLLISLSLGAIAILLISIMFYASFRKNQRPVAAVAVLAVVLVAFGYHLYIGDKVASGIITAPQTYVMAGPSSAAPVIEIVSDGNRMEVVGKKDVWLKVRWDNATGYVRQNNLQLIEL
jgi:hypothetical protein